MPILINKQVTRFEYARSAALRLPVATARLNYFSKSKPWRARWTLRCAR